MAPISPERLLKLEQEDAPIIEQIQQVSLFAGIPLLRIRTCSSLVKSLGTTQTPARLISHGRREYVLRWLLKKLQEKDTRRCPTAWRLLRLLIDYVPLRNVTRILNEKKLVVSLRQALEEAVVAVKLVDDLSDTATGSPVKKRSRNSSLKKRKRDGNISSHGLANRFATEGDKVTWELEWAIYEAIDCIVQLSRPGAHPGETFTSEYMRSTIRTSSDEAARILGAWLVLCGIENGPSADERDGSLLPPFLEVWASRILGPEDVKVFSEHCLTPSLIIMSTATQLPEMKSQLEILLARNIMVPAKTAYGSSKDTSFLINIIGDSVFKNPPFAPVIFDLAIRSIQPHGSRPRQSDDTAWLQAVISALKEASNGNMSEGSIVSLNKMLRYCINHKIALELSFLRSVTFQYGLPIGSTNWDLLATVIELDSNTFLIPSEPVDLLNDLLTRITNSSTEAAWPTIVDKVVDQVLAPLMGEFAKARQLTAFIYHWYAQLAEVDKFCQSIQRDVKHFTAWEDEALRVKLRDLLEPSLTTLQIIEIHDWLVEKIKECEGAACVLLEAVAEAVSREDVIITLRSRFYEKVANVLEYKDLDDRYKARLLHLNTIVLSWSSWQDFGDTSITDSSSALLVSLLSSEISFSDKDHSLLTLEAFRYLCAMWSIGPVGFRSGAGLEILSSYIPYVASHVRTVLEQIPEGFMLGEERWEGRVITIKRGTGWLACAYASCILVEYPQVLDLCMEGQILTDFIWIASATTPSSLFHCPNPWLRVNYQAFPTMWMKMLQYDGFVENSPKISRNVIQRMLECGSHIENPIERSKACNGFVIMCFHHLPLELLLKSHRESILKAWQPESSDPTLNDPASLSYKMAPLDPAVLGLKMKMLQRPILYDGINFQELVDLAESIVTLGREPEMQLSIFAELPELIFGHVFATIDQPKSLNYFKGSKEALENWLQVNRKAKKVLSYAMIRLVQVVIKAWTTKGSSSDEFSMALKGTTEELSATFRGLLLSNLRRRLQKPEKLDENHDQRCMSLYSTMNALDAIGVGESDLADLQVDSTSTLYTLSDLNSKLGKRFEEFMTEHCPEAFGDVTKRSLGGDVTSVAGRQAIQKKTKAVTERMTELEKRQLVTDILKEVGDAQALDKLLALKHVIVSCEDSRTVTLEGGNETTAGLSLSYSTLAAQLQKTDSVRRFHLISEIMEMILRNKPRTVTQYNIDTTLASITILCSRDAPNLYSSRAGTIYHQLINLVNAILTSHRLKLQGRFHVVVQTLQSLLYCLFTPSSTMADKFIQGHSFPPWLTASPATRTLNAVHAEAYTRLLTLICDPSVSAVSRPSSSSLNSAIKKAKTLAGLHMPFVLSTYIRAQLDMSLSMRQGIRDALTPGWYAVFDTMTVESRKALGEGLDASGRAILANLVKDWLRFGKWNGA